MESRSTRQPRLGGLVLAGGGGARLGGADKATIEIAGRTLLEHALDALVDVDDVVVVGAQVITDRPVTFRLEDPPGGGPAAAVAAGLTGFVRMPTRVMVLACDMPRVDAATVRRLVEHVTGDGAMLVDATGRLQYLCGVYDTAALRAAAAGDVHGMSMRELVRHLDLATVPAFGDECRDIDSWDDVRALREAYGG